MQAGLCGGIGREGGKFQGHTLLLLSLRLHRIHSSLHKDEQAACEKNGKSCDEEKARGSKRARESEALCHGDKSVARTRSEHKIGEHLDSEEKKKKRK
jgi:hypothetical protein